MDLKGYHHETEEQISFNQSYLIPSSIVGAAVASEQNTLIIPNLQRD
jgi:hypothetical protein